MSKYDAMVSAEAWEDLHRKYQMVGRAEAEDHVLAELLRDKMWEVEEA